jgi:aerobic carbon-monoxide dehydrogenase medium subunit
VPADLHAPADYRRRVGAVTVTRAWRRAVEEARGG